MPKAAKKIPSVSVQDLNDALRSGDPQVICTAIGQVVRDYGIAELARKTGLQRASIYRAFGGKQSPNFTTVMRILTAMCLQLKVDQPKRPGPRARHIDSNP